MYNKKVLISTAAFIIIAALRHYNVNGAYIIGLLFGSMVYWCATNTWPTSILAPCELHLKLNFHEFFTPEVWFGIFDLSMISIVILAGISANLANLAGIERDNGTLPRSRWLFFACGIGTILGSSMSSGIGRFLKVSYFLFIFYVLNNVI